MSISGNLQTMALTELLQWLGTGMKTGTLRLDNGTVEKRLHFTNGRIVSTASSDPNEYLGHFLVSHGYITEPELGQAVEMQESNKMLLGKILSSIGVISEDDLETMLFLKTEETIYELFTWEAGEFQFTDEEMPDGPLHEIDLDVTSVVLRGSQRLDEWGRIRKLISSPQSVPVSISDLTTEDPGIEAVLAAIDDDRSVADIALHTHSSEYRVGQILADLIEQGRLKIVRPRGLAPEESEPLSMTSGDQLVQEAQRRLSDLDYSGGLKRLRAAKSFDPGDEGVAKATEEAQDMVRSALTDEGVELTAIPKISDDIEDIRYIDVSADEGFLLSRINGATDVQTILKISPLDPLEARVALLRLKSAGYVTFD